MNRRAASWMLSWMAIFLLSGQSCITVSNNPVPGGGDDNPPPEPTEITVRFINSTDRVVDVQFYTTGQAVANVDTDLFTPANLIAANIGFAGTGILEARGRDQITLSCDVATTLGTRGGRFLDADSGELIGTGRQQVLFTHLQYVCGNVITFTYNESGGAFSTGHAVE